MYGALEQGTEGFVCLTMDDHFFKARTIEKKHRILSTAEQNALSQIVSIIKTMHLNPELGQLQVSSSNSSTIS